MTRHRIIQKKKKERTAIETKYDPLLLATGENVGSSFKVWFTGA
jgi:hypothetical protein